MSSSKITLPHSCGFLYVAFGDKYRAEAVASAKRLLGFHPDARITIVTETDINETIFENVIKKEPFLSYMDKVANMSCSPYDQTLFLDTDTYVCEDISEIFGLLTYYDICIAPEVGRPYWKSLPTGLGELRECNTGVILFKKNTETDNLFLCWRQTYKEREAFDYHDQTSMAIAIAQTNVRFGLLPNEYNLRANHCQVLARQVKIIHARCRNYELVANRLNMPMDVGRNWLPSTYRCVPIYGVGFARLLLVLKLKIAPITKLLRRILKKEGDLVLPDQKRFNKD